jgi:hypothetical protein
VHVFEEPVNVLRLELHPDGLAPQIVNLGEWCAHLLDRLGRVAARGRRSPGRAGAGAT